MKILITGASGFIGKRLSRLLIDNGHEIHLMSRHKTNHPNSFVWDIDQMKMDHHALQDVDAIIHLAGANIGDSSWTASRKKELIQSRVQSSQLLLDTITTLNHHPKLIISASAVGYYGANNLPNEQEEDQLAYPDFLGQLCQKWENSILQFSKIGIRTVCLRTGVVVDKKEGALKKIFNTMSRFVLPVLGNGNQIFPWIHIDDLCKMYLFVLENEQANGAYNAVAPQKLSYSAFIKSYVKAHQIRPIIFRIPIFVLKIMLGAMHQLLCYGAPISTKKIQNLGFAFQYPTIQSVWEAFKKKLVH